MSHQPEVEESKVLSILDKNVGRVMLYCGLLFSFVKWVVLPIQDLQIQVQAIQVELSKHQQLEQDKIDKDSQQDVLLERHDQQIKQLEKTK